MKNTVFLGGKCYSQYIGFLINLLGHFGLSRTFKRACNRISASGTGSTKCQQWNRRQWSVKTTQDKKDKTSSRACRVTKDVYHRPEDSASFGSSSSWTSSGSAIRTWAAILESVSEWLSRRSRRDYVEQPRQDPVNRPKLPTLSARPTQYSPTLSWSIFSSTKKQTSLLGVVRQWAARGGRLVITRCGFGFVN